MARVQDRWKQAAAESAVVQVAIVQSSYGMIVGLGSGSMAALAVSALGKRVREAVVIDPGDEIQSISLRVKAIITHAHVDHIGGAQELKAAIGAPV